MNQNQEIYGETRLKEVIEKNAHLGAKEILYKIIQSVEDFTDNALQHDDFTLVVIKTGQEGKIQDPQL